MIGSPRAIPIEELRAVVAHVRAIEARSRPTSRAPNWTYPAFLLILLGSLRAAPPGAYLSSSRQTIEESRMRTLQNLGVVSSIAIASVATAQNAVEWRVADGGNGHWYQVVSATGPITWSVAKLAAEAKGAHLVTLTSAAEEDQVWSIASAPSAWMVIPFVSIGPWLGGLQASNASSPADGWSWVTGEPWLYSAWLPGEPNEGCGSLSEDRLHYIALGSTPSRTWNDFAGETACPNYILPRSYVVEWDADCNNDGIVDYGQIRDGSLADVNGDNIPDCCALPWGCDTCPADIDQSGAVGGVDLAAILNVWGTSGGKYPRADINRDGIVDGADLSQVLNAWGLCQ